MSATLDILFGVAGQALYFDAPEGRPSSIVSSQVFESGTGDDGTAEAATTGSAAVEADPNTTFDAASGAGQVDDRICYVTDTTGVVIGRPYRVTNATGEWETIEACAISSGAHVVARESLANAYAPGDAFVSTRVAHALDSTWLADTANLSDDFDPNPAYRWRLAYVVGGATYVHDIYFDLVRYAARYDVTPADVDRRSPGWIDRLATRYREDQGRSLIEEGFTVLKFDLYNLETPNEAIRNREVVNELVLLKAIELADPSDYNVQRYADRLAQLIARGRVRVQADSSGAAVVADARPFWRR